MQLCFAVFGGLVRLFFAGLLLHELGFLRFVISLHFFRWLVWKLFLRLLNLFFLCQHLLSILHLLCNIDAVIKALRIFIHLLAIFCFLLFGLLQFPFGFFFGFLGQLDGLLFRLGLLLELFLLRFQLINLLLERVVIFGLSGSSDRLFIG